MFFVGNYKTVKGPRQSHYEMIEVNVISTYLNTDWLNWTRQTLQSLNCEKRDCRLIVVKELRDLLMFHDVAFPGCHYSV